MTFAVVEYSSKSGDIWQHTKERPNYLCDPALEMDPTSFGCYVSAMSGEHIPLVKIINTASFINRLYRKINGHWPNQYSLDYFGKFDRLLVIHEAANSATLTSFIRRLKSRYPHLKILGVPTQPYGLLRLQWHHDHQILTNLQEFSQACDAFITIAKSTTESWQNITQRPVYYLPQPYPVEFATKYWKPQAEKQPIIFIPGVTDRPQIILGHQVAVALQKQFPDHVIHVTATPNTPLDLSVLTGANYQVQTFLPWHDHLRYLSAVKLVINTDFTQTRGRVQMDCAAVGTSSVGADSDAQLDLFPHQAAGPKDSLDEIIAAARDLLANKKKYQTTIDFARAKLPFYSYEQSAHRINHLYSLINQ
jgi:hypothetical protein